jgi:hypothetical protein
MDDACADRQLLALLRQLAAADRQALAAAGPPPDPAEVRRAAAVMDVQLPDDPPS